MKTIGIKQQPRLGMVKIFSFTITGIRYRLFRSFVTLVVVAVAIAFMMNILSESILKSAIVRKTRNRIREKRLVAEWSARLSVPGTPMQVLRELSTSTRGDPSYQEALALGKLSQENLGSLLKFSQKAVFYLNAFDDLDYVARRRLVHDATESGIFDRLQDAEKLKLFASRLQADKSIRFPQPIQDFKSFLGEWPVARERVMHIREGRKQAIGRLTQVLSRRPAIEILAQADGETGDTIRAAGFKLDEKIAAVAAAQARQIFESDLLEETITNPHVRKMITARLDILSSEVSIQRLWGLLKHEKSAKWYLDALKSNRIDIGALTPKRVVELSRMKTEAERLFKAERLSAGVGSGFGGIGERMGWLAIISMIVCIVGVANVMLMSVTERFREIATLKCLGALDSFIMISFIIEACLLGIVGGACGSVLGVLIGLGRMSVSFGSLVFASIPYGSLVSAMALSVVMGVVLAVVASVYPSFKAARLAPMDAMRVE